MHENKRVIYINEADAQSIDVDQGEQVVVIQLWGQICTNNLHFSTRMLLHNQNFGTETRFAAQYTVRISNLGRSDD